jgi:hypothetical protein
VNAPAPGVTALSADRPFSLIKNGELSPIDAWRYVPGTVVAVFEDKDLFDILFRKGDQFFRKVAYKNAAFAWTQLKGYLDSCSKHNVQEVSRLKFWATKGKGSDMPPEEDIGNRDATLQTERHPEEPEVVSPERHTKYGHRWTLEEFQAEFNPESGEVMIAYDSQLFDYVGWQHTFLVRTDDRGSVSGKRLFVEAVVSERNKLGRSGRWSGMHAEGKYRNLRNKVAPMEPEQSEAN